MEAQSCTRKRTYSQSKMDGKEHFERSAMNCSICLDLCTDVVETSCCGNLFCAKCTTTLRKCPICRARCGFNTSHFLRRLIGDFIDECQYCHADVRVVEKDTHQICCAQRHRRCNFCPCSKDQMFAPSALVAHMAAAHVSSLLRHNETLGQPLVVASASATLSSRRRMYDSDSDDLFDSDDEVDLGAGVGRISPAYEPTSPAYEPTSPAYEPTSPAFVPPPPVATLGVSCSSAAPSGTAGLSIRVPVRPPTAPAHIPAPAPAPGAPILRVQLVLNEQEQWVENGRLVPVLPPGGGSEREDWVFVEHRCRRYIIPGDLVYFSRSQGVFGLVPRGSYSFIRDRPHLM